LRASLQFIPETPVVKSRIFRLSVIPGGTGSGQGLAPDQESPGQAPESSDFKEFWLLDQACPGNYLSGVRHDGLIKILMGRHPGERRGPENIEMPSISG
jgi:hypothetical protein